ncbi:hypothetical protein CsSME_00049344 [Camellia sinensis var. sinensis]
MDKWDMFPSDIQWEIKKKYYYDYVKDIFGRKISLLNQFNNTAEADGIVIHGVMKEICKAQVLLEQKDIRVQIIIDRSDFIVEAHEYVYTHCWHLVMAHRIAYEDYRAARSIGDIIQGRYYVFDGEDWQAVEAAHEVLYEDVVTFFINNNGIHCYDYEAVIKIVLP